MFWTVLVFIGMVVLGGFISYFGDLLGRRIGKKRVRVLGMRPKHTAILITSLTGSFLVVLSTLALLLVAPTVRKVVLRGEATIREYDRQKVAFAQQLATLKQGVVKAQSLTAEANQKLQTARNEMNTKQADILALKQRQTQLISDVQIQLARSKELGSRNQKLVALNTEQEKQSLRFEHQNAGLGKQTIELTRQNDTLQKQNELMKRKSIDFQGKLALLQSEAGNLENQKKSLIAEKGELTNVNNVLKRVNTDLNDANQKDIERANKEIKDLREGIETLVKDRKELLAFLSGAKSAFSDYLNLRVQRIILPSGEVVARQTLDTNVNREDLRKTVNSLVMDASAMAQLKGAGKGENGLAVRLMSSKYYPGTQEDTSVVEGIADEIWKNKESCVIFATTIANTTEGEPALVRLSVQPVRQTYKRGAIIASRTIDTNRSLESLVNTLVQFLQEDVRNAAVEAGTIPQLDRASGVPQVGLFGASELVDLTDRLRKMGGEVEVTAIAERNLNSADPLRLKFRLSRPKNRV
ncbi:hypothetical protein LBMAG21_13090 [Armatimonadota bacterium]|nr:hypothetical protein LBMAG21_13090 [Armatimonadota bacterium]